MSSADPKKPALAERARYAFDNLMAKGTSALVALLALLTFASVSVWALVVSVFGLLPEDLRALGPAQRLWFGLMRAMDAGAVGADAGSWPFLLANLGITIAGIFVVSALIGVLNAGLESKLAELRRGRSKVLERDHVVVLGWNASIFTILDELVVANENRRDTCVVVLADRDKAEMEEAVAERIAELRTTRVVCRAGSTTEPADLAMVSVDNARAILVLSPEVEDADVQVIKTLLALLHSPERKRGVYHVVAELRQEKNLGIARMVGRHEVEVVLASDLISRITVQTCRQSGLSVVHTELLDFGGDEIYFAETDTIVGRCFGDVLNLYPDSSVIGLRTHEGPRILPDFDERIAPGDRIIAISRDDDTVVPSASSPAIEEGAIHHPERAAARPERNLVLGWNERVRSIASGLDAYVAEGSELLVVAEGGDATQLSTIQRALRHQTVRLVEADTTDREVLDGLEVGGFDHIIVLGDDTLSAERSDARVLVTLLHLREIGQRGGLELAIVSEIRDVRNRRLAEVTNANDFIVSDKLVSLMMSQVAENKELHGVLSELFHPDGAEIYLKPASDFVREGADVNVATIVESARRRGEIAIGYRIAAEARDASRSYGVRVNPPKAERVVFGPGDKVIVVSAT